MDADLVTNSEDSGEELLAGPAKKDAAAPAPEAMKARKAFCEMPRLLFQVGVLPPGELD